MVTVKMTLMDYFQMTLIDFYLQRKKVVAVVVAAVDVDHCIRQTFVEIAAAAAAAAQIQLKMMTIVVMMVDLPAEYAVVTQVERAVLMVAVLDCWVLAVVAAAVDIEAFEHMVVVVVEA